MATGIVDGVVTEMPDLPLPAMVVPVTVTRFQARAVLHLDGTLIDVEALVAAADPLVQIAWVDASEFRRDSPAVASIATAMGWSQAYVDDMFIRASKITA